MSDHERRRFHSADCVEDAANALGLTIKLDGKNGKLLLFCERGMRKGRFSVDINGGGTGLGFVSNSPDWAQANADAASTVWGRAATTQRQFLDWVVPQILEWVAGVEHAEYGDPAGLGASRCA